MSNVSSRAQECVEALEGVENPHVALQVARSALQAARDAIKAQGGGEGALLLVEDAIAGLTARKEVRS